MPLDSRFLKLFFKAIDTAFILRLNYLFFGLTPSQFIFVLSWSLIKHLNSLSLNLSGTIKKFIFHFLLYTKKDVFVHFDLLFI